MQALSGKLFKDLFQVQCKDLKCFGAGEQYDEIATFHSVCYVENGMKQDEQDCHVQLCRLLMHREALLRRRGD